MKFPKSKMGFMAIRSQFLFAILLLLSLQVWVAPASAQEQKAEAAPAANTLTPDQARAALDTLQDDAKRKQIIDTLRAIASAGPATAVTPPVPVTSLSADGLGAQLLLTISDQFTDIAGDVSDAARSLTRFPALWFWLRATLNNPAAYSLMFDITWKLAIVFGGALLAEWVVRLLLRRPQASLERRIPFTARASVEALDSIDPPTSTATPEEVPDLRQRHRNLTRIWQSLLRIPFVIGRLLLELIPLAAFAGVVTLLLGTDVDGRGITRLAIVAVVNGYLIGRAIVCVVRALFGPLGLVRVRDETAVYIEVWTRRIVTIGVTGLVVAKIALLLGLSQPAYLAFVRLVMLVVHLMVVIVILQCRRSVAAALRVSSETTDFVSALRNRAASMWHAMAIALVLGVWFVWAWDVQNGFQALVQYLVGTLVILLATRLASMVTLGLIDRGFRIPPEALRRFPGLEARANLYLPILRHVVSVIIAVIGLIALLELWGVNAIVWFYGGQIGGRLISAVVTVGIAALIAVAVWEASNALIDKKLMGLARDGSYARAARLRTFQPMLRSALMVVIVMVVALTALSEIGINVAPLLAGAGIIGVAIGFGSQKLVQDVITGLFILLESNVQVGDTVTLSGLSGVVENVSIRTIRLRAGDGAVHILPFSAVTTITNASRGVGNASVSVDVAFAEDTDRVSEVLKEIVSEMRSEAKFRHLIRGDLDLWGVDKINGSTSTIVGQIPCTDSGRWPVQREFNRRMKIRFQQEGIEIASTNQIVSMVLPPPDLDAADNSDFKRRPERARPAVNA